MTRPKIVKTPEAEAELTRKLILGLLGTLEQKGILAQTEVNNIILAARQAAYPEPPQPKPVTQVAPGRRVSTQWPTEAKVNAMNPSQFGTKKQDEETSKMPNIIDIDMT